MLVVTLASALALVPSGPLGRLPTTSHATPTMAALAPEAEPAADDRPVMDTTPLSPVARVKRALTFWSRVVPSAPHPRELHGIALL